ncbi:MULTISPECIES: ATP-binding protein [Aliiglaciecola]|uniref:ATP-binding protein n=1 Tax=Aliiglaciecola TaxID=1406885 RepID=UPI001C08A984|nr:MULTISPECIES: ATP-binding protein [Aliiglaciecola]MBU2879616.1 ATP-binding protein [Aliiglaciecola lipolytica]MDO6710104.1 ATP-binding protein [Aliiglaciecola sp. 2_MG-2023]MDO6751252.1 ATP-binding protein [Aliiglaciecola sp. 1_MG-2023]
MPGLHRIILIDTHLPGVVELKLNGHTNICGTNASGKTTLQRLIPVFYGEYPSRVVPSTRDSFEKWYLPRESSFIVYEYARNEGDLCQAVLASSGNGVNYRFIGKPFELNDYLYKNKAGEHSSVTMNELARSLKRANILVTNLLNTKEFKAVLQNDRGVLNDSTNSRELLGYARIFSLCEQANHLRHIEKLAKAVHSKEGKMETIKAMIAAILEEDGVQPPSSSLSRNRVEDWIKECHLIKEFDAIRPEFAKLEQADHQLNQTEYRLSELQQQFAVDTSALAANVVDFERELDEIQLFSKKLESDWTQQRDELNQALSVAKADSEKLESDLEQIESEYDDWQSQDIETLQSNLQQLPQWESELETSSTRYTLLTEKHQDVEASFNKRVAQISEKLNEELEGYSEEKSLLQDKLSEQKSQEQLKLQQIRDDYQGQLRSVESEYRQRADELKTQYTEITAALKNAGFDEFEQSQLDILDATLKEAGIAEDAAREKHRKAQQEFVQASQLRVKANAVLEETRRSQLEAQHQLDKIEGILYPGENSLLEFLRKERPDWQDNLGKVLHPELFKRKDLKPSVGDDSTSIFGIKLDLHAVDMSEFAETEVQLQQKLSDVQQILDQAIANQNEAELDLAKASEEVRNKELAQAKTESACKTAEATRRRAQQDKDQVQQEYAHALSQRKLQNKKRLSNIQTEQSKCKTQHAEAIAEVKDQQREAETEHQFHWQQLIQDIQTKISIVDSHIKKAKQVAAEDKQKIEQWKEDELNNRGVDVDDIGTLQKRIKQLQKDITYTDTHRHKVKDYQRWYDTYFVGYKVTWQQNLTAAKKAASKAERLLNQKQADFKQQRQKSKDQQAQLEQDLRTAREQHIDVQSINRSLGKLRLVKADQNSPSSKSAKPDTVNIGQRISEGQELLQTRDRLLGDIKVYVEHFDQLIAAQSGTGLADIWERSRDECAVVNDQGIRNIDHRRMVVHLAQLLNEVVPQKLHGLREQGRIFGADLTQYYNVLEDIDKRIASQSKRISKEVDEELFLDGVSDSAVKIRSRISELEFWPELAQFNKLYQAWMKSGAVELPDDEYALSMRKVLDILGRAALSGGISKLLDIELHIKEGNSNLVIRTDRQLNESSSHGMAYLILCKFLLAFTRLLRGDADATIHWPIDELGTLHQSNVKKIFDACQNNNISVVGAFPNPESEVLTLFDNRYLIDKTTRKLQVVQPKVSAIAEHIQKRKQTEQGVNP